MSYSRRCAEAPIGNILETANADPDWNAEVLGSGELCLSYKEEHGHYIFGFMDPIGDPERITTSVVCYSSPSDTSDDALRKLIRSAK